MTPGMNIGGARGTARRTGVTRLLAAAILAGGSAAWAADPPSTAVKPVPPPGMLPANFQAAQPVTGTPAPAARPVAAPSTLAVLPPELRPIHNPLLAASPASLSAANQPTAAARAKVEKYVDTLVAPETSLDLVTGQTRVLKLKVTPFRIAAADDGILAFNTANPSEILLQGKGVGSTVLTLWFGDAADAAKQETLSYLVRVYPDPEAKERLEKSYKQLETEINKYFKDTSVQLKLVGDKLVVSGRVRDFVQGGQILKIIAANVAGGEAGKIPVQQAAAQEPANNAAPSLEQFQAAGGQNVINLLEVPGEQQVQLRVIVAEVNRSAARSIGLNFGIRNNQGVTVFANNTGPVGGGGGANGLGGFGGFGAGIGAASGLVTNIATTLDAGKIPLAINALRTLEYARSLAEPTLVAMNGQTATFQSGGQFPVPILANNGGSYGGSLQGVSYVPYGVILNFTPFITDRDRIRLNLGATVSTRDIGLGTNIGGGTVAGLNTRNVNTTVELRQGETLAVAGLLETNLGATANRVPFIGDLPYLTALLGTQRVEAGEKELVIFITPELARPLDPGQMPYLPGSEILDPSDHEFYLWGRLEGHCRDFRSPIRTDWSRIKQYKLLESAYIAGPSGYTAWPHP